MCMQKAAKYPFLNHIHLIWGLVYMSNYMQIAQISNSYDSKEFLVNIGAISF